MARVAGTTVVTGVVRDQAELHGFIERIEELGLELVEVRQVSDAAERGDVIDRSHYFTRAQRGDNETQGAGRLLGGFAQPPGLSTRPLAHARPYV